MGAFRDSEAVQSIMNCRFNIKTFCLSLALASLGWAQAPAAVSKYGSLTKLNAGTRELAVKTDQGEMLAVTLDAKASFRKIALGETDLRKAETIALADIAEGDRVMVRGKLSEDQKSMAATMVLVMSSSDVARKQANDRADWEKRGVSGEVTGTGTDKFLLRVRGKSMTVTLAPSAGVRRYAQDSVKFADAKPATLAEIKSGDQARVRGARSEDGSTMTADEIVFGSFRTIAAQVTSVDGGVLKVKDLDSKKPMVLKLGGESTLKKLPEQMAQMIAQAKQAEKDGSAAGSGGPPAGGPPAGGAPPEGRGGRGGGPGGPGGGRGMRVGNDLTQMLDRVPPITVADLKPGDAVIVLSSIGAGDNLTVVTLLAGVESILTRPGTREMSLGGWTLGAGGGEGN